MKRYKICVALVLASSSFAMFAQAPAPQLTHDEMLQKMPVADQPTREDILKLFEAMHLQVQLESMIGSMNMQVKRQLRASMQKQPPAAAADAQAKLDSNLSDAANIYPVSEMMDDMIPIYQRHMSKSDVAGIVAFYGSPAGQHLLVESPMMVRESMSIVVPKANARMEAYVAKKLNPNDPFAGKIEGGTGTAPAPTVGKPIPTPSPNPPK
jgi:hypothetical protein